MEKQETSLATLIIKKLVMLLIISVVFLFATNIAWLYAFMKNQSDYALDYSYIEQETDGDLNFIGEDGDIINGEAEDNTGAYSEDQTQQ